MEAVLEKNKVILKDIKDFDLTHVFECGQCFRWNKEEDESFTGVAYGKVINVKKDKETLIIDNTNIDDYNNIWSKYFDLDNDYTLIKEKLNKDNIMEKAIEFGTGIRILNQDEWETLISFIISANNRIPMIRKVVENLSKTFGSFICEYKGKEYYSFPQPEQLVTASVEELRECKTGFRAKRIKEAAERIVLEKEKLYLLNQGNYNDAFEYLKTFNGVGDKVAHCVLLFSMRQFSAFPVDVWVRRIMNELYLGNSNDKEIRDFAENKFGDLSGFAQQYLFYYARENGIGKK